jgi:7-cyano-7-deazaguanine synthase
MAWAEGLKAEVISIGVKTVDYSGYQDCSPKFIEVFQTMVNLTTKIGVTKETIFTIETPLIQMSKSKSSRR